VGQRQAEHQRDQPLLQAELAHRQAMIDADIEPSSPTRDDG
jgi:hypothetical protein